MSTSPWLARREKFHPVLTDRLLVRVSYVGRGPV